MQRHDTLLSRVAAAVDECDSDPVVLPPSWSSLDERASRPPAALWPSLPYAPTSGPIMQRLPTATDTQRTLRSLLDADAPPQHWPARTPRSAPAAATSSAPQPPPVTELCWEELDLEDDEDDEQRQAGRDRLLHLAGAHGGATALDVLEESAASAQWEQRGAASAKEEGAGTGDPDDLYMEQPYAEPLDFLDLCTG